MAHLNLFSYRPGNSLLHRLDPRFKLLFMIVLSLGSINAGFLSLLLASVLICFYLVAARVELSAVFRELRIFPFFLLFIFLARSLSTPGEMLFELSWLSVTREGVYFGLQICWRLSLIVLISIGFVITTTSSEIKAAIEFYLRKIPKVPEQRVSTMLSLMIRFIPLIFSQIQQTLEAQKARCIEKRKNPVVRLVKLTIPVMRKIFQSGDRLAIAMASRCYSDNRTSPSLVSSSLDWLSLAAITALVTLMQFY